MKSLKKSHYILIAVSVLILLGCISITAYLLFSNYQNVRLFKQAQENYRRGDNDSLAVAEVQLQQIIRLDSDNETAFIMLGEIAGKRQVYPEQVYYCYMAHRLNPLSSENTVRYIKSLWYARYFDRLENFLLQQNTLSDQWKDMLLYSAGRNGSFGKYKRSIKQQSKFGQVGELALLLFSESNLTAQQKLAALKKITPAEPVKQEILAAQAELFLQIGNMDDTEKALLEAYQLNSYAFAPALGRFYANYRSFGKALPIFEKHLESYHDPVIALQAAELYCMVKRTDEIRKLRKQYQADAGQRGMLLCYYFDALIAFAENDMVALKELLVPLRKNINTPLARFMFFCADIRENNISEIISSYKSLLSDTNYPDLQRRADDLLALYLKNTLTVNRGKEEQMLVLATLLHERKKELFTAKFILLMQKQRNQLSAALLRDTLKRYPLDQGVLKIAIEYYLNNDLAECGRLIKFFKQNFPQKSNDMMRYELVLALRKNDLDGASQLFRKNFSPEILPEYWNFASSTMREEDLLFLSRQKQYAPFCQALLMLKKGNRNGACDLLEKADAGNNQDLLFMAARTLAENNRNHAALRKYAMFPEKSPYKLDILLNTAELTAEIGENAQALELAAQAYKLAPDLPETQYCYADKLYRNKSLTRIPDIVKLKSSTPLRKKMEFLWVAGMQQRIKECDLSSQQEKARELCRQLLAVAPHDKTALEYLQKLKKLRQ